MLLIKQYKYFKLGKIRSCTTLTNLRRVAPVGGRARAGSSTTSWAPQSEGSWCCTGPCPPCASQTSSSTCQSRGTPCSPPLSSPRSPRWRSPGSCPGGWCSSTAGRGLWGTRTCPPRTVGWWTWCSSSTSAPAPPCCCGAAYGTCEKDMLLWSGVRYLQQRHVVVEWRTVPTAKTCCCGAAYGTYS